MADRTDAATTAQLIARQRALRRAKARFKRVIARGLSEQLRAIIDEDFDKIAQVIQMGGMVRVGIEVALPEDKVDTTDAPVGGTTPLLLTP